MRRSRSAGSETVWRNWGRTVEARPLSVVAPASADEVSTLVRIAAAAGHRVKAVGAGHSFTGIAQPEEVQMTLDRMTGLVRVDAAARTVTLRAGTRLHAIPELLAPYALAMENVGDIDAQSIAGAISTGTHGTGRGFRGIAAQVRGAVLVTADGELLRVDADHRPELLPAVALGLGALGVLVEVTLQCVEAFDLAAVETAEPLHDVLGTLDERVATTDHFEFYWFPHTDRALTKSNTRVAAGASRAPLSSTRRWFDESFMANGVFGATTAFSRAVPAAVPVLNRAAAVLSGERAFSDVSSKVFTTRRSVRFVEMEYAISAEHVVEAFAEVRAAIDRAGWRISFPIEVRFAAEDELWLSTAYRRRSAYIAVHRTAGEDFAPYFHEVERIMRRYDGRPHWGKMHWREAGDLAEAYPRFTDFTALREHLDPQGVFLNPYLRRVLGA
ncbi:D-arabinono-1,4-lactone oxidase [Leucobacter sp. gxy201]|uniref:D-arabinono-1,4-lactone oxidase n=1 Tax=Leucobacter sp. gxy201 TaxID=2957200 RepID=UPI003D9FC7A0